MRRVPLLALLFTGALLVTAPVAGASPRPAAPPVHALGASDDGAESGPNLLVRLGPIVILGALVAGGVTVVKRRRGADRDGPPTAD